MPSATIVAYAQSTLSPSGTLPGAGLGTHKVTTPHPLGPLSAQSIDRVPKHQLIALQHACCPHYALRLHTLV